MVAGPDFADGVRSPRSSVRSKPGSDVYPTATQATTPVSRTFVPLRRDTRLARCLTYGHHAAFRFRRCRPDDQQ